MKLRIKGNSIRLRLTKTEIKLIESGVSVRETVHFGPGVALGYRLLPSPDAKTIRAEYSGHEVAVLLPMEVAKNWASSDEIALKNTQALESDPEGLSLLIEKDFVCLKPRQHQVEDETDLFANPNEAHGHCG
jgi:hypothetical protein